MILKDAIEKINVNTSTKGLDKPNYFTVYRPGTFTNSLLDIVKKLVNPVIGEINDLTKTNNILNGIDNVLLEDFSKSKRYTIDFFIYDITTFVKTRLICIFVIEENKPNLLSIHLSNSKYINNKMYNNETKETIGNFQPSVLESSLEKSLVTEKKTNPDGRQSDNENSWIQPKAAQDLEKKCMDVFPSRKVKHDWTVEGIQYTEHCKNSNTNGINSGFNKRRIVANFNPTIATLPSDNLGLRGGLFNLGGIMPGFPTTGGSSSRLNPGPPTS